MFKTLLELLKDNQEALAEAKKIQSNYDTLSSEVATLEAKLNEAITKRDKYKRFTKSVKNKLNIEEGEELNDDTLNTKFNSILDSKEKDISEKEKIYKLEIEKLEKEIEKSKEEAQQEVVRVNKNVLDSKLELELYKTTTGINAVNKKASQIIIDELKNGATFEDGKIVYKDKDGTTIRKNGVALTLSQKLEDIKSSEDYSFLFKSNASSGSGLNTGNNSNSNSNESEFTRRKREQAAKLGISI